jgi:hypothetical protein
MTAPSVTAVRLAGPGFPAAPGRPNIQHLRFHIGTPGRLLLAGLSNAGRRPDHNLHFNPPVFFDLLKRLSEGHLFSLIFRSYQHSAVSLQQKQDDRPPG